MQFELSVERAARQHEQAVVAEKEVFIAELEELVERPGSGISAYKVRTEVETARSGADGAGAGRSGNGDCRNTGPDRSCEETMAAALSVPTRWHLHDRNEKPAR